MGINVTMKVGKKFKEFIDGEKAKTGISGTTITNILALHFQRQAKEINIDWNCRKPKAKITSGKYNGKEDFYDSFF